LLARAADLREVEVQPVDCLAVCERPVTLAFQAAGGWTYIVGDADPARDLADILAAARAVAASPHGIPAMEDRPPFFRKGVIARVPPAP
jgi:predicted metal-binding protein